MARTYGKAQDLIDFTRASSATYLDSDGLLKTASNNIPRIEYDANGNLLGLLVEESRTNIIRYSENFSLWSTNGSITRTISSTPSPDGQLNAYDVTDSGSGDEFIARYDTIPTTVTSYVSTVFAEKTSGDAHYLNIANFIYGGSSQYLHAAFNTNTGEFTAVSGISISDTFVEDRGSYWRIGIKVTNTGANNTLQVRLYPAYNSDGGTVRNASTTGSKTLFGVQLEAGSFPTSYIPNYGTSGGVTRSADVANITTNNFGYNKSEGAMYVEVNTIALSNSYVNLFGTGGSSTQSIFTSQSGGFTKIWAGDNPFASIDGLAQNITLKIASSFTADGINVSVNGSSIASAGAQDTIDDVVNFKIGGPWSTQNGVVHIKSAKYIPRSLTNAQLQELTS